jgi:hypothetical protein
MNGDFKVYKDCAVAKAREKKLNKDGKSRSHDLWSGLEMAV